MNDLELQHPCLHIYIIVIDTTKIAPDQIPHLFALKLWYGELQIMIDGKHGQHKIINNAF